MKTRIIVVIMLVMIMSCYNSQVRVLKNISEIDSVRIELSVDINEIKSDEDLNVTAVIMNKSARPIAISKEGQLPKNIYFRISQNNKNIIDSDRYRMSSTLYKNPAKMIYIEPEEYRKMNWCFYNDEIPEGESEVVLFIKDRNISSKPIKINKTIKQK